jgi:TRAP-type C4-dicarboxylate transport system substrate-binding protein
MNTFEVTPVVKVRKLTKAAAFVVGVFLFLLFSCPASFGAAKKQFVIKLATLAPDGSTWMNTFGDINEEIVSKTGGKIKLRAYPGGVLGEEKDMLRKIRIGQIHAGGFTGTGLSLVNRNVAVTGIPFLFENYGEVDYVVDKMDERFRNGFEEGGYVLLGWSEIGFVYLLSNVPVVSSKDMRGTKVWLLEGDPIATPVLRKAGITPIPLGIPDVLMALQTNLIDVVYASPLAAIALQWFTKVKYMTNLPLIYALGGVLVTKKKFNRLPPDLQVIVKDVFQHHTSLLNKRTRRDNDEAIRVMVKQGIKLVTPSSEETEKFKQISRDAMGDLTKRAFSKDVLVQVRFHLDQYRKAQEVK